MKIFIELPKEIKNILVDPCGLKEDIRYSAILGLQYCLALKLLNYLGTANSHTEDKIKLDLSDRTPIPL